MFTRERFLPDGVRFSGSAVMQPGPMPAFGFEPEVEREPEVETESIEQALSETYQGLILDPVAKAKPQSKMLEQEKAELLSILTEFGERVGRFLAQVKSERQTDLERRLEQTRGEGQEQIKVRNEAEREFRRLEQALVEAKNGQAEAKLRLVEHRDNPPGRFVKKAGRVAYARRERELIQACREADRIEHEAMVARNQAAERCNRENAELARIAAETDRLEAAAKGKKIHDPLTGIFGVPEI